MGRLIIVLAESALELVPRSIANHPSVVKHARGRGRKADEVLLDRCYHHFAMKGLPEAEKRGRPDIVHFTLLSLLGTPLNRKGLLECYVHTREDRVITVDPKTRLPRSYDRFLGLMEQLFRFGAVPPDADPLMKVKSSTLAQLVMDLKPSTVIGLSTMGSPKPLRDICEGVSRLPNVMVLIGGFPKGHFTDGTLRVIDSLYRIHRESLDSWIVASRLVYQFELSQGIIY
ncbi:MAG: 16S rRNA methyltransferase [Candidatus Bathyarchaeia archaeon]|nr:16S rRNA methyltransferase [Candidatus Bathyarchaeota archaeon]